MKTYWTLTPSRRIMIVSKFYGLEAGLVGSVIPEGTKLPPQTTRFFVCEGCTIGKDVSFQQNTYIGECVKIGDHVSFGKHVKIGFSCKIGKYCDIGNFVTVGHCTTIDADTAIRARTKIEKYCNIGCRVTIKEDCRIDHNSVVEQGTLVGKSCTISDHCNLGADLTIPEGIDFKLGNFVQLTSVGVHKRTVLFHPNNTNTEIVVCVGCQSGISKDTFYERIDKSIGAIQSNMVHYRSLMPVFDSIFETLTKKLGDE